MGREAAIEAEGRPDPPPGVGKEVRGSSSECQRLLGVVAAGMILFTALKDPSAFTFRRHVCNLHLVLVRRCRHIHHRVLCECHVVEEAQELGEHIRSTRTEMLTTASARLASPHDAWARASTCSCGHVAADVGSKAVRL